MAVSYLKPLVASFTDAANPTEAVGMKRYMRDQFEFLGIKTPLRKALVREFIVARGLPARGKLFSMIRELYSRPEREYHYFAIELTGSCRKEWTTGTLKLLEYLIVTNSWWDTVDPASSLVGEYFRLFPDQMRAMTTWWVRSDNIWLNRTAIIFQRAYKRDTDTGTLFSTVAALSGSDEFFIRKAIGWALREYGKVDPEAVHRFAASVNLSPLSRREALRIINNK